MNKKLVKNVTGKDIFERINYLYQDVGHITMAQVVPPKRLPPKHWVLPYGILHNVVEVGGGYLNFQLSNISLKENDNNVASSLYSNLLVNISKKAVQRLEPNVKRSICKKCHNFLVPGVSAKVRVRRKIVRWTCQRCQNAKVFRAVPGYQLWIDNKEAIVETIQY